MKTLWKSSGDTYVSPTEFKSQIQKFAPRFVGSQVSTNPTWSMRLEYFRL